LIQLLVAIETRSLPSSLAAFRRGFTFYLADPSTRLTAIARTVQLNRLYLQKGRGAFVFVVAAGVLPALRRSLSQPTRLPLQEKI
jgi:hypothetical protein